MTSFLTIAFDETIMRFIQDFFHTGFLDRFFILITHLGDKGILWIALALFLLARPQTRRCGILMACSLALSAFLGNQVLKPLFQRDRPCALYPEVELLIQRPMAFSFPSGHSISSFASASALLFQKDRRLTAAGFAAALLIAFSRVYLFVHWPTDVLAGALLGTAVTLALAFAVPFFRKPDPLTGRAPH